MAKRCPYCDEEIQDAALKCKHCLSWLGPGPEPASAQGALGSWEVGPGKGGASTGGIRRPKDDRMLSGVCAAIGRFLGVDPTPIRIVFAVFAVFTAGVPAIILYIILTLVIPTEEGPNSWAS